MFAPVIGAWHSICGFFHDGMFVCIGLVVGFVVGWVVAKFF